MTNFIFIILILLLFSSLSCNDTITINNNKEIQKSEYYYTSNGEKIFLERIESKIVVTLNDNSNVMQTDSFLVKYCGDFKPDKIEYLFKNNFSIVQNTEMDLLKSHLFTNADIENVNHYYYLIDNMGSNNEVGIFNQLNAKVKTDVSDTKLEEILVSYNLEILKKQHFGTTYKVPSGTNTLEISNKLYEEGIFEYASPNFLSMITPD